MKKILNIAFLLSAIFMSTNSYSQLSISFYSSSLSKIGLGYNFTDRWWSEVKLYSNTFLEDISPELVVCCNIVKKDRHAFYVGIGGTLNIFNGPVLPVGVQFTPFEKMDRFTLHIELEPTLDIGHDIFLQSSWGLRYKFW